MKRAIALKMSACLLLIFGFFPSAHALTTYVRLPVWRAFHCGASPYSGQGYNYTGDTDGCSGDWAAIVGAASYDVKSSSCHLRLLRSKTGVILSSLCRVGDTNNCH